MEQRWQLQKFAVATFPRTSRGEQHAFSRRLAIQ